MNSFYNQWPVLIHTDPDGFRHKFYVMYHATPASNVESILANSFCESTGGMLGPGLYVSRDIDKTRYYSDVCFKLLVYTGKTRELSTKDTSGSWRSEFDTVYIPPNNDVVKNKREEFCLKSAKQARILGIAYGFDSNWSGKVRNLEGADEELDEGEWQAAEGVWRVDGHLCRTIEIVREGGARRRSLCIVDRVSSSQGFFQKMGSPDQKKFLIRTSHFLKKTL